MHYKQLMSADTSHMNVRKQTNVTEGNKGREGGTKIASRKQLARSEIAVAPPRESAKKYDVSRRSFIRHVDKKSEQRAGTHSDTKGYLHSSSCSSSPLPCSVASTVGS